MPVKILVDQIKKTNAFGNLSIKLASYFMEIQARIRMKLFEDFLIGKKAIDVGLGTGSMAKILMDKGFKVVGIDVTNTSLYENIQPVIYDGENIPYKNNEFDIGTLICVLHHCTKQIRVLEETMRVCKRVIIVEDTFRNSFERMLVAARDNFGNFEFYHHQYRTSEDWQSIFKKHNWKVKKAYDWSNISFFGMYGRQSVYVIEK